MQYKNCGNIWSHSWSYVVGGENFGVKTVVGHGIGHKDTTLGVGRVVCMKHRDFCKSNRNKLFECGDVPDAVCDIQFAEHDVSSLDGYRLCRFDDAWKHDVDLVEGVLRHYSPCEVVDQWQIVPIS